MFKTITTPAYHIGGGYYPQERKVPCDYDPVNWQIKRQYENSSDKLKVKYHSCFGYFKSAPNFTLLVM
jgi:hypothetical protein